jgi:two-component sensor histidine kinase
MSSRTKILEPLQLRLLKVLLTVALAAAIPALATGIYASLRAEAYIIIAVDIAAYLGLIGAFLALRRGYRLAAVIFVYSIQVLAVVLVISVGTEGASVLWLAAAVLAATLLLDLRHTLAIFVMTVLVLVVTTWLLLGGNLPWSIPVYGWYAVLGSYFGISIFLSAGVRFLLHHLSDGVYREQLLNREIQHRVRNNLQLIESLLSIEAESVDNSPAVDVLRLMMARVSAISHAFDNMETGSSLLQVHTETLLGSLVQDQQRNGRAPIPIDTAAMPEWISLDVAVPFAMVVAELFHHFNIPGARLVFRAVRRNRKLDLELQGRRLAGPARWVPGISPAQYQIMDALVSQFGGHLTISIDGEDEGTSSGDATENTAECLATIGYPDTATGA